MRVSSKIIRFYLMAFALAAYAQVPVAPIVQPRVFFVTGDGSPCAGCTLSSYIAGTTTALATYTDSIGISQNHNPIILDASGGAQIWLSNAAYKFILRSAVGAPNGATIWSVDNVKGGGGLGGVCSPAGAVQIANTGVNGLTCDPAITINTTNHTLNVGTITGNRVTIGSLSSPTSWTFDTTSPATALASLNGLSDGAGTTTANQIALSTTTAHLLAYSTAIPNGTTATTQAISDNSTKVATTAYVALPGIINPSSVQIASGVAMTGNQGNSALVQHSAGTVVNGHYASFDANGNTIDSGIAIGTPTPRTCNANGCYRIDSDGTIEEWGVSAAVSTASVQQSVFVTFPLALASTTNASLQAWSDNCADTCAAGSPKNPIAFSGTGDFSTSGATMMFTGVVPVGGGGASSLAGTIHAHWHLIQ